MERRQGRTLFTVKGLNAEVEDRWFISYSWRVPTMVERVVPPKVAMFVWQLQRGRIATKQNLLSRGVLQEDEGVCVFCLQSIEDCSHLFLHCHRVWLLWMVLMAREGVMWVIPRSVEGFLLEWSHVRAKSDSLLWDLVPYI